MPWRSVKENIALGLLLQNRFDNKAEQKVERLLSDFGLEDAAELYPHQISGGMARRASLAQILAVDPELLLLDEPFTGLDFTTHSRIAEATRTHIRKTGASVVLVTHNPDEALLMADRMILLGGNPTRMIGEKIIEPGMVLHELHSFLQLMDLHHALAV